MNLHTNFNVAMDMLIDSKLKEQEEKLFEKIAHLEKQLLTANTPPNYEI